MDGRSANTAPRVSSVSVIRWQEKEISFETVGAGVYERASVTL